jgi:hypothetical protein
VVRRVRSTADDEAKVVIGVSNEWSEKRGPNPQHLLTVYLKYHDGLWTAVRFSWSCATDNSWNEATHFLMDAIDEAAEK